MSTVSNFIISAKDIFLQNEAKDRDEGKSHMIHKISTSSKSSYYLSVGS